MSPPSPASTPQPPFSNRGEGADSHTRRSFAALPGVIETELDVELVLLDAAKGEMFSLNATGRVVWRALGERPGGVTVDTLVAAVVAAFDVDLSTAESDVISLLRGLEEANLIATRPDDDPP